MTRIKNTTKAGKGIIAIYEDRQWSDKGSIYDAYATPSSRKVAIWNDIERRANDTQGYNHDLRVVSRNTYMFTTIYTYTDSEGIHYIYDTPSDTKEVVA